MKPLPQIKKELHALVPASIADAIKALKELLPDESGKYRDVLALEGRLNETNKNRLFGVISDEQLQLAYNRLRKDLLDLIAGLEENDFDPDQAAATSTEQGRKAKRGNILYRIPGTMPLGKESKCIVRIALDRETIIQNIELDEHLQLKDIRVSDIMYVELVDPSEEHPFQVRSLSSPEQFIEEGEYTEWIFKVKPLAEGIFPLMLKVSVIELIQGKERKREIVLEEQVQIVTEGAAEDTSAELQAAGYSFSFSTATDLVDFQYPNPEMPAPDQSSRKSAGLRRTALMLAGLIAFTSGAWAIAPARVEWAAVRYLADNDGAYEWYIERHEESPLRENAYIRKAEIKQTKEAKIEVYDAYLDEYQQEARFREDAKWEIAELKDKPIAYLEYLHEFPEALKAKKEGWTLPDIEKKVVEQLDTKTDSSQISQIAEMLPNLTNKTLKKQVQEKLEKIDPAEKDWSAAQQVNTYTAYQKYLKDYPDGAHATEARTTMTALVQKEWEAAKKAGTKEAITGFLNKYPDNAYTQEANDLLGQLNKKTTSSSSVKYGRVTDKTGHTYRTLVLNGKTWIADNLNIEVPDSWCYDDDPSFCDQYGRLYTKEAAKKACTSLGPGWRLPTAEEWRAMAKLYGGINPYASDKGKSAYKALVKGGQSGFAALLGGEGDSNGGYDGLGRYGSYWSSTHGGADGTWYYFFNSDVQRVDCFILPKSNGFSCRCLQD